MAAEPQFQQQHNHNGGKMFRIENKVKTQAGEMI